MRISAYLAELADVSIQDTPESKNFERLCLHAVDVAIESCRLDRSSYSKIYDYRYTVERRRLFGFKIGVKRIVKTNKKWKFFSISVLDVNQSLKFYRMGSIVSWRQFEPAQDDRVMVITTSAPWIEDTIEQYLDSMKHQRFICISSDEGRLTQVYPDSLLYILPASRLEYRNSLF